MSNVKDSMTFYEKIVKELSIFGFVSISMITSDFKTDGYFACISECFQTIDYSEPTLNNKFIYERFLPVLEEYIQSNFYLLVLEHNYLCLTVNPDYISIDVGRYYKEDYEACRACKNNAYYYCIVTINGEILDLPF
jgi:hypothetical protein